jgi:hypothetical protein
MTATDNTEPTDSNSKSQSEPTTKKVASEPAVAGYSVGDLAKAPFTPPDPESEGQAQQPDTSSQDKSYDNPLSTVQDKIIQPDNQEPKTRHKALVIIGMALLVLGVLLALPLLGLVPAIITMLAGFVAVIVGAFVDI